MERQGGTRTVSFARTRGSDRLRLTASDDGGGRSAEAFLIRLRTRKAGFAALAGVLTVNWVPGEGTTVSAFGPDKACSDGFPQRGSNSAGKPLTSDSTGRSSGFFRRLLE